ncbi:arginine--tRNA ligase [Qiania dongpingensis]|uniref:Arginine--tRNA ligase n=1 Tax=Qiania dongpingensis TaxID=2763669 RepID=A0A7G9G4A6_9FIRM|nr:arginine--tRNA ligase [Qiania dongpingensis]QNM05638.1 arginine--tRNA ligase [Qiania dongpingensis]
MKKLIDLITETVEQGFEACGYEGSLGKVTLSNRPDLCEYQCNGAMAGAKLYKKAPIMIAGDVVEKLKIAPCFEEAAAVSPGFINLKLSKTFLADYLEEMDHSEKLGVAYDGDKETIVIDYGGPNVAKPLHVGHLRSAIIGESMKRLGRFLGHEVIGDVHLGDWGLQMGLIIEELKERKPELPYFDEAYTGDYPEEAPFTIGELEEIYPAASAKSKADEAFAEKAHDATFKLQRGDKGYMALWNHILNVSVSDLKKNYEKLNVTFDIWKKESDAQPYIPAMVQEMKEKGFAHESQGALVVDVKEDTDTKEIPPCILLKSDGATLYSTTDLATLVEREKLFSPDRVLYVVDKRQELHFTQVFRCAKKTGIVRPEVKLDFLGFGTMNGKDGKPFKTRDGGVMRLEYLIKEICDAVYEKIMENRTVSETEARKTAEVIGLAALKYGDLSNQASKDYMFDVDRFISFEGDTGPYILYTIVRIKSIQAKYEALPEHYTGTVRVLPAASESEKALQIEVSKVSDALLSAFSEQAPHKICQYIYDLSNAFNRFYHETKIMAEEDKERQAAYIRLLELVKRVLETCIGLLGFEAPDRM